MVLLFLLDGIIIQLSLWVAIQLRFALPFGRIVRPEWNQIYFDAPGIGLFIAVALLWVISFISLSVYTPRHIVRWFDETQRVVVAHTIAALSLAGLLYLTNVDLFRLVFLYFYIISLITLLGYRYALRYWYRLRVHSSNSVARILIVGAGSLGRKIVTEFHRQQWPGVEFVGFLDDDLEKTQDEVLGLPILARIDEAKRIIHTHEVDEVIIALPSRAHIRLASLITILNQTPVRVRVIPDYFELAFFGATVENLGGIPLIGLRDPAIDSFQRFLKRLLDLLVASATLLLTAPIFLVTAIAIKMEDNGPVFYRAERVGENGRLFRMFKFRSMIINADQVQHQTNELDDQGNIIHKTRSDPRVTNVGRFIRRTSIDELPQLLNVIKGEMSLVGPRPELPWLAEKYEPWQRKRFAVPQGITGWWQVNGRSDNLMHLHTDQDLYYINNYSVWLDIQILWRTVAVVIRGKGAY